MVVLCLTYIIYIYNYERHHLTSYQKIGTPPPFINLYHPLYCNCLKLSSFPLIWECHDCSISMEDRILGWQFFSFRTWKALYLFHLTFVVSNEICGVWIVLLSGKRIIFFGCFYFFSLFLFFRSLIMLCLGMHSFRLVLFGVHSASLLCMFTSLPNTLTIPNFKCFVTVVFLLHSSEGILAFLL